MTSVDATTVPILLLGFNRPDKMRRMLEPLSALRPHQVFVAVDGPRHSRPSEPEQCRETQRAADEGIDWPCEVRRLYRESNLGCRAAVSGAISWALSQVEEVVVVEDDCIVDPTFFTMCRTLLDRHRDDERVFCIAAVNFQSGRRRGDGDYYASKYPHCWGWATWKRAWMHYEDDIEALRPFVESSAFEACHDSAAEIAYWRDIFQMCVDGRVDSWAYRWTFSCWKHRAVTLLPNRNLVINIGFDAQGTHTKGVGERPASVLETLESFNPPSLLSADKEADRFTFENIFTTAAPDSGKKELQSEIKRLQQELKQSQKTAAASASRAEQQLAWARKHPVRAAWRTLRGKFPLL